MTMYDKDFSNNWRVDIEFDQDATHTHATVYAQCNGGEILTTRGDAHRDPTGCGHPMIGEEVAAARGLIALGTELLQIASSRIEHTTHVPHDLCG
jgi:Domain of unknown function (DUF1876)